MKVFLLCVVMFYAGCIAAADMIWRGPVYHQGRLENLESVVRTPFLQQGNKTWVLRGNGALAYSDIKVEGAHYIIRGRESADKSAITVTEMTVQTEWDGRVSVFKNTKNSTQTVRITCENDEVSSRLDGPGVAPLAECSKHLIWIIKGEMKDRYSITVTEMKLKDPQPPLDPRFKRNDKK